MQIDTQGKQPPPKAPFQFGLKHLLALPVLVAGFFAVAAWLGMVSAIIIAVFEIVAIGLWFRPTRKVTAAAVLILGLVALLTLPVFDRWFAERTGPHRPQCGSNLKQIGVALWSYHDAWGCFPPAYIADESGRPMHSWRVLILPYMEHGDVYAHYRFDEPWDGPNNRKLAHIPIPEFNCPEEHKTPSTVTSYLAVVGPQTAWPGSKPVKLADVTDGASNTILVVEVKNSGIHWMEPRDLHVVQMGAGVNPKAGQSMSSVHPGGANMVMADGSVHFLADDTPSHVLRALLTINGQETVEP